MGYIRERELRKTDYNQRRWSNREQAEFYRTISTFGVQYIRKEKRYDWIKFRQLSRLDKKYDETLTEYFRAFMAMCKWQCGIRLSEEENQKMLEVGVDRLPEERARRVLERVDLLNRLRNDVLPHPKLQSALDLALPSKDMPEWWIPSKHDHDLLKGVGRHGLGRTDYYILYDPELSYREIIKRHTAGDPLITKAEKDALRKRYYKDSEKIEDKVKDKEDSETKSDIQAKTETETKTATETKADTETRADTETKSDNDTKSDKEINDTGGIAKENKDEDKDEVEKEN